ncbi:hypothetical protein BCR37DRAFT_378667 [Protomyces lactucae-debilis]|uniref:Uncharacterized protein n=1 Tax=Protomyces lactucae-debilis TaxID=2754530 RepID=A0A1Y2FID0_PROLT|nr:uncharacterized protein BCR37DRAFT_378667 [Protomyces lactucae-debilis]ORY83699.1 hypothetical protein BCR37DRAFT_378667 [Protomyces lactucae-debilis]
MLWQFVMHIALPGLGCVLAQQDGLHECRESENLFKLVSPLPPGDHWSNCGEFCDELIADFAKRLAKAGPDICQYVTGSFPDPTFDNPYGWVSWDIILYRQRGFDSGGQAGPCRSIPLTQCTCEVSVVLHRTYKSITFEPSYGSSSNPGSLAGLLASGVSCELDDLGSRRQGNLRLQFLAVSAAEDNQDDRDDQGDQSDQNRQHTFFRQADIACSTWTNPVQFLEHGSLHLIKFGHTGHNDGFVMISDLKKYNSNGELVSSRRFQVTPRRL